MKVNNSTGRCVLCQQLRDLTFHHTIPKKLHPRKRYRRRFSRSRLEQGIKLCQLCHRGLHALYDETTLAENFDTIDVMLKDDAISRHVAWSARQKRQ
jgi:hypothetical protein